MPRRGRKKVWGGQKKRETLIKSARQRLIRDEMDANNTMTDAARISKLNWIYSCLLFHILDEPMRLCSSSQNIYIRRPLGGIAFDYIQNIKRHCSDLLFPGKRASERESARFLNEIIRMHRHSIWSNAEGDQQSVVISLLYPCRRKVADKVFFCLKGYSRGFSNQPEWIIMATLGPGTQWEIDYSIRFFFSAYREGLKQIE